MNFVEPTGKQLKELAANSQEGPIVMINLLRFKPEGGAENYQKYAKVAGRLVKELGGRIVYHGQYRMPVIGHENWDEVLLVEYPSVAAFLSMIGSEAYLKAAPYRSEALLDSRLYFTKPSV